MRESRKGSNPKHWELTVKNKRNENISGDRIDTWEVEEKKYVTSCGKAEADDVKNWWNRTYYDPKHDSRWVGDAKCVSVKPYEPKKRNWIIMPTLKNE